jgi:hypothetical protein
MKVEINKPKAKEPKLKAVVGIDNVGVYLQGVSQVYYLQDDGLIRASGDKDLADVLGPARTPIYEGDTITLQF